MEGKKKVIVMKEWQWHDAVCDLSDGYLL